MEFYEVVRTRRSVRGYVDRDVPPDVFARVLDAARLAPSANNKQPWHLVVVREAARRAQLATLCADQTFVREAPVVVVFAGTRYVDPYGWIGENMFLVDVTIAVDHFTLAARAEGLGTCWVGAFDKAGVAKFCGLPQGIEPIMVVPLGYPVSKSAFRETSSRKSLDSLMHEETY